MVFFLENKISLCLKSNATDLARSANNDTLDFYD
jgi:hypothetical protein